MRLASSLIVGIAYIATQQAIPASDVLWLKLSLIREVIRIDEPIELEVAYINAGNSAVRIARSYSIGPDHINIIARDGTCEYQASPIGATIMATDEHLLVTPLLAHERITQPLIRLNDIESLGGSDLILPREGKYSLRAVFTSQGNETSGSTASTWRGSVTSDPISLIVLPPSDERIDRMRAQLEEGVKTGSVDPVSVAYFRYVRDGLAADLLIQLITRGSVDPLLGEAVARQERPQDASALETLSQRLSRSDPRLASYTMELAKRLRTPRSCT